MPRRAYVVTDCNWRQIGVSNRYSTVSMPRETCQVNLLAVPRNSEGNLQIAQLTKRPEMCSTIASTPVFFGMLVCVS